MTDLQHAVVGLQVVNDGVQSRLRAERSGALVVQQLHGAYTEENVRGNVWTVSTAVAGVTVTASAVVSTASAMPIVGIYNPPGTGKNLVVMRACVQNVTGSQVTFLWGVSNGPAMTAAAGVATHISMFNFGQGGSGGSVARSFAGATGTVGTPITFRVIYGGITGTVVAGALSSFTEYTNGDICVPPGNFAGIFADLAPTAAVVRAAITWAEVPV